MCLQTCLMEIFIKYYLRTTFSNENVKIIAFLIWWHWSWGRDSRRKLKQKRYRQNILCTFSSRCMLLNVFFHSHLPKSFCRKDSHNYGSHFTVGISVGKINQVWLYNHMQWNGVTRQGVTAALSMQVTEHVFGLRLLLIFLLPIRKVSTVEWAELCDDLQFVRKALSKPLQSLHYMDLCFSRHKLV